MWPVEISTLRWIYDLSQVHLLNKVQIYPWKFLRLVGYMTPLNLLPLTIDDMKSPRGPGEYLVDVHIARGLWEITGQHDCEWAVFDITSNSIIKSKSIINKKEVRGTIFISEKAYWVRIGSDCYTMTYLHN